MNILAALANVMIVIAGAPDIAIVEAFEVIDRYDTRHEVARGIDGVTYCRFQEYACGKGPQRRIGRWTAVKGNPSVSDEVARISAY